MKKIIALIVTALALTLGAANAASPKCAECCKAKTCKACCGDKCAECCK